MALYWPDKKDREFLRRIMHTGGYFTPRHAGELARRLDMGQRSILYEKLKLWRQADLIKELDGHPGSRTALYKLTSRALRILDNLNSHIRRAHRIETVIEKLRTLDFALVYWAKGYDLAFTDPRKQALVQQWVGDLQAAVDMLPKKPRGRVRVHTCDQVLAMHPDQEYRLFGFHLDKETQPVGLQLAGLLKDLEGLLGNGGRFTVITFDPDRAAQYRARIMGQVHPYTGGPLDLPVQELVREEEKR